PAAATLFPYTTLFRSLAFLLPMPWANWCAVLVFAVASITDWFDGYLARRLGQTSAFGAFLDPVADKLIVAVALVALLTNNNTIIDRKSTRLNSSHVKI